MNQKLVIGADIGGTNTALGVVTEQGEIISEVRFSTHSFENPARLVETLSGEIRQRLADLGAVKPPCGFGLGAPNGNIYTGMVEQAPNLIWKGNVDLRSMFQKALDIPVVLTNDANAAAIGEMIYGGAKGMRNFVVITIGTGLGSGIVVNGELLYGHTGFAGEIGHTTAVRGGRMCTCGRIGCLEAYVSARGILQTVNELLLDSSCETEFRNVPKEDLTPKAIAEAAMRGDMIAIAAFTATGEILGRQLADTVAYLSPEAIFLYGGIANAGDLLLRPTRAALEANVLSVFKDRTRLEISNLHGKSAAILGAAALAWKTFCV